MTVSTTRGHDAPSTSLLGTRARATARSAAAAALLGASLAAGPLTTAPAQAAGKPGACAPGEGVTVIVQDPNNNVMRCSPGDPANGEEALEGAGFTIVHNYSGLICQIGYGDIMYPQECPQLPMPYWSYWQAQHPGDSWYYSDWGAITYDPNIDDFEGWRFGIGHTTPNNGIVPLYAGQTGPQPKAAPAENMPRGVVPSGDSGVNDGSWDGGDYSKGDPNHPNETFNPSAPENNPTTGPTTSRPKASKPTATSSRPPAPTSSRPAPTQADPTTKRPTQAPSSRTTEPETRTSSSTAPRPTSDGGTTAAPAPTTGGATPGETQGETRTTTAGPTGGSASTGDAADPTAAATRSSSSTTAAQSAPSEAEASTSAESQDTVTGESVDGDTTPSAAEGSSETTSETGTAESAVSAGTGTSETASSAAVPTSGSTTSDPAAPVGEPTRNENAAAPSGEAPTSGAGGLLLTGGILAAAALGVGAWLRFGRR